MVKCDFFITKRKKIVTDKLIKEKTAILKSNRACCNAIKLSAR